MGSVAFAVAVRTEADFSHPFGGLIAGPDAASAIEYGINYGGNGGFSEDEAINRHSYASRAAIIPISEKTALLYRKVVEAFRALQDQNRLPFYVTGPFRANSYFEQPGPSLLPDGTIVMLPDSFGFYDSPKPLMYNSYGHKIEEEAVLKPPGLQRIRSNCATFFNLAAELAGVDFEPIDKSWFGFRRGRQLDESLGALFTRHSGIPNAHGACYSAEIRLSPSKSVIAAQTPDRSNIHFASMIDGISAPQGGLANLKKHIHTRQPLERPPRPWPSYLKAQLDFIRHQVP